MKHVSIRLLFLASLFAGCTLAMTPNAAWAETDCRDITSIKDSADLAQNETDGGHVAKHVIGETAPSGYPRRLGTTAFKSKTSYDSVWTKYLAATLPSRKIGDCSGTSGSIDKAASLTELGLAVLKIDKCTGADSSGDCNAWTETDARNVSFTFTYKRGQWILNSSFPME